MSWLSKRLTPAKQNSPVWVELSDAVATFWDEQLLPDIERMENAKTIFHAHPDDLDRVLEELGDLFDVDNGLSDTDKPIAISWRRNEVHLKSTTDPIQSIIARNFKGMRAKWEPLYCNVNDDYATATLMTEAQITADGSSLDQWFMTSRGSIVLDSADILRLGLTLNEAIIKAKREVEKVRAAHTVMDGFMTSARVSNGMAIGNAIKRSLGTAKIDSKPDNMNIEVQATMETIFGCVGFRPTGVATFSGTLN